MAPALPRPQNAPADPREPASPHGLFLEPMMGTPLAIYVQKDVDDRDTILDLIVVRSSLFLSPFSVAHRVRYGLEVQ